MPRNNNRTDKPQTTAQRLGSVIKSVRDTMRKDKGLSGELDRLPMLTWIMFLKFLDDQEEDHQQTSILADREYRPPLPPPYRWRDWAAPESGMTGETLLRFIEAEEEVTRADGTKGTGLLAYLRGLESDSASDRRGVIARVFQGIRNRMESGYLLRDILNSVNTIHFNST